VANALKPLHCLKKQSHETPALKRAAGGRVDGF
jgi:hypothetical protein